MPLFESYTLNTLTTVLEGRALTLDVVVQAVIHHGFAAAYWDNIVTGAVIGGLKDDADYGAYWQ